MFIERAIYGSGGQYSDDGNGVNVGVVADKAHDVSLLDIAVIDQIVGEVQTWAQHLFFRPAAVKWAVDLWEKRVSVKEGI